MKPFMIYYLDDDMSDLMVLENSFSAIKSIQIEFYKFSESAKLYQVINKKGPPDLLILDIELKVPSENGFDVAEKLLKSHPEMPIVMFSNYADNINYITRAENLSTPIFPKQIANQLKPLLICDTFKHIFNTHLPKKRKLRSRHSHSDTIGETMNRFINLIPDILNNPFKVALMVSGENGSGKSFYLRSFFHSIPATIPKLLVTSPISSINDIKKALNGWLIIDGLVNVDLSIQTEILSLIQAQSLKILITQGTSQSIHPNLIRFLKQNEVTLIPLRERRSEIPAFISKFISGYLITSDAKKALINYDYKSGNLSELKSIIDDAIRFKINRNITISDLPDYVTSYKNTPVLDNTVRIAIDVNLSDPNFRHYSSILLWETIKLLTEYNIKNRRRPNISLISNQVQFSKLSILERLKEIGVTQKEIDVVLNMRKNNVKK